MNQQENIAAVADVIVGDGQTINYCGSHVSPGGASFLSPAPWQRGAIGRRRPRSGIRPRRRQPR